MQRGGIEDVAVLDVAELVGDRGDELGVVEPLGELEVDDQVRRVLVPSTLTLIPELGAATRGTRTRSASPAAFAAVHTRGYC